MQRSGHYACILWSEARRVSSANSNKSHSAGLSGETKHTSGRKNWRIDRIRYKTCHLKELSVQDLLLHHARVERDDAAGKMTVWWTSPPPILHIHSLHQVATGAASHFPLRCLVMTVTIFRGSGTYCMVSSVWDLKLKRIFVPNFHIYLTWEFSGVCVLSCFMSWYWGINSHTWGFIRASQGVTHPRFSIAGVKPQPVSFVARSSASTLTTSLGTPGPSSSSSNRPSN